MDVSGLVKKLETELEIWRGDHAKELEADLGEGFSIGSLITGNEHTSLSNYFFPVMYKEKPFGIILPFRIKKKAIFASPKNRNVYEHASEVFESKGYNISFSIAQISFQDMYCLTVD